MKTVLAMAVLLFVIPTHADSIEINAAANFVDISVINGVPSVGATVETFETSFLFDTVTQQVSDLSFTASGLLGKHFHFTGVSIFPFAGAPDYDLELDFSNRRATIETSLPSIDFPTSAFPTSEIGGTKPLLLECLTRHCEKDFGPGGIQLFDNLGHAVGMFLGPSAVGSAVPEPSSLSLLGIGLLGAGWLTRKRKIKSTQV